MFTVPTLVSPKELFGRLDENGSDLYSSNKDCLRALGLPSSTIDSVNPILKNKVLRTPVVTEMHNNCYQLSAGPWAMKPTCFPVFTQKHHENMHGHSRAVIPLIYRRLVSYRQPCAICARPVDVFVVIALLECAHLAHVVCMNEMMLNGRSCTWCENAAEKCSEKSGKLIEHLLYFGCCMYTWK